MPYWRLFYHLIWSTKQREPRIDEAVESTILRSFRSTLDAIHCIGHAVGFMPDHVHIALSIPPSLTVADAVGRLKGASTHAVNQAHAGKLFGWQAEYGALSFGEKSLPDVISYIENQKSRHAQGHLWPSIERIDDPDSRL